MDNACVHPEDEPREPAPGSVAFTGQRWCAPPALVSTAWLATGGALVWCLLGPDDPAGRLLIGVTAAVLAAGALYGTRARPRLAADAAGIQVGGLRRRLWYPWSSVRRLELVHTRRFGRDLPTLEIDTHDADGAERLHVFGRLELGADPREVAARLDTLRRGADGPGPIT